MADRARVAQDQRPADGGSRVPTLICRFLSGAAAQPTAYLGPGRHLLGNSPQARIRIEDPALEPHHLMLEIGADGAVEIIQIAGRLRARLEPGGDLLPGAAAGRIPPGAEALLWVGGSRIRLTSSMDPVLIPLHEDRGGQGHSAMGPQVIRGPRTVICGPSASVQIPLGSVPAESAPPASSLIAAAVAVAAGLIMAAVLGNLMFAAFAVMGAVTTGVTWGIGRLRSSHRARAAAEEDRRSERETLRELIATAAQLEQHLHRGAPEICSVGAARHLGTLWARRPEHEDCWEVTLGVGDRSIPLELIGERDPSRRGHTVSSGPQTALVQQIAWRQGLPVVQALDVNEPTVIALTGPLAHAVMRSVVVQVAVATGPADLRIVAVTGDRSEWDWVAALPHSMTEDEAVVDGRDLAHLGRQMLRLDDGDPRRLLLLTDRCELLTYRTGPVRRLLDLARPITVIAIPGPGDPVPAVCTTVIATDPRDSLGVSLRTARAIAQDLRGLEDPEDANLQAQSLPRRVELEELTPETVTSEQIAAGWIAAGRDPAPAAIIGQTSDGLLEIDMVVDGPHGLVAGTTGSGKSELLRSFVISLALRVSPEHLQFVLVDYKGGSTFDACAELPHTVGLVTDLDEGLAERALISLSAELHRRERILRSEAVGDLTAYRALPHTAALPRLMVIIDEFAALAHELPGFVASLIGIAQRGRSLGVHLILATQRPAGVIDDAIRANTDLRIALRLNDAADARDVVGDERPVGFARGIPGRSLMRLGAAEAVVFQAASSAGGLRERADAVIRAAEMLGHRLTHRPWLPALDEVSDEVLSGSLGDEPGVVGIIDDPACQTYRDLLWDRSGGLALIGSLGSGTTSTMVTLLDRILRTDAAVVFVIDAAGDPAVAALDTAPGCAGVIGVHDRERIERLLARWSAELDHRQRTGSRGEGEWVLAIDGLMGLRRSCEDLAGSVALGVVERLLAEGPAVGMVAVATVESGGGAGSALVNRFAMRWVHHLEDPAEGALYGVAAAAVPPAIPGRIRVVSMGLYAQVCAPSAGASGGEMSTWALRDASRRRVERIEALTPVVRAADLAPGRRKGSGLYLVMGIAHRDLGPAVLEVTRGDHVMVLGPPRSGRSEAAAQIARSWQGLHPQGRILKIEGRSGGTVAALPEPQEVTAPLLVIVDDAERVSDPGGGLLALVECGLAEVMVVAVARAEGLRGQFGHWTTSVRRSRVGVVMAAAGDLDGDLLSVVLPRRCPVRPRPGLAWIVDAAGIELAQLGIASPADGRSPSGGAHGHNSTEHVEDYP